MNMIQLRPDFNGQSAFPTIFADNCDRYWEAGLPVIPLKHYTPNGGRGGEPTGKEPAYGGWEEMASRMPTEGERARWKLFDSTGNIGLPLGPQSGLVAIDIDTDDPRVIKVINEVLPASPWHRIGQKGRVQLYRWSSQSTVRIKCRDADGKLKSLVEILSTGTQVVLPPSIHPKTVQPYTANCDLLDCLEVMVPLPADTEKILREALAGLGYELDGGKPTKERGAARFGQRGRVGEGARNDTLFKEACRLRGQGFDLDEITALLRLFNTKHCDPVCDDAEVEKCASQGAGYDPNEHYTLNDSGNAARFARDHAGRARYVSDADTWRIWNGRCWEADPGELGMLRLAAETVAGIKQDAEESTKPEVQRALTRHARNSGDHARLRSMIKVAASLTGMAAHSSEFDELPGVIVAANGAIDLNTAALMPHDPERLSTKALQTAYRPEAEAPTFMAFLERVQPDPEVRTFLQRVLGQALHGQRAEQIMTWWHGRGRNGKSVLADTLLGLLPGYVVETSASTFLADDKKDPNRPRSDLMRLRGSRLVVGAEAADRRRADGQRLKQLTGDATLTARELQGRETAFPITFHIAVLTNPWPNVDEADDALWTRLVRVPFPVTIPAAEQIKNLHKKILATEAEGVLAWLVRGAVDYAREGLTIPPVLIQATADWRRRIGTIERYMRTYTRRAGGKNLQLRWLHSEYVKEEQKIYGNPAGEENFRTRLEGLGYTIFDGDLGSVVT